MTTSMEMGDGMHRNINVIYHHYPHYRSAVMRELVENGKYGYRFWGSTQTLSGIVPFAGDETVPIRPLNFRMWRGVWILRGYWPAVVDNSADALILLANPNMPATWFSAIAARIMGKKVLFWTHGWLKPESFMKRQLRRLYYALADHMLVYGDRARETGIALGYSEDRITTVYNSLDYKRTSLLADQLDSGSDLTDKPQSLFPFPEQPLVICTARLTELCRFDLLLAAAAKLKANGRPINVLLVGDGPARSSLEHLAKELQVDAKFYGACYDEATLANLIYFSDVTVSPGKIGLSVIHSLSYGTPAITHGEMDEQMPEVEAIIPGETGAFFKRNSSDDLADVIEAWLSARRDRTDIRRRCYQVISERWNPVCQRVFIENALDRVFNLEGAV